MLLLLGSLPGEGLSAGPHFWGGALQELLNELGWWGIAAIETIKQAARYAVHCIVLGGLVGSHIELTFHKHSIGF